MSALCLSHADKDALGHKYATLRIKVRSTDKLMVKPSGTAFSRCHLWHFDHTSGKRLLDPVVGMIDLLG
jgi:hypothetical protein